MPLTSLFDTTALCYYVCVVALVIMAVFVLAQNAQSWLNRCFALTSLSLLAWLGTLFAYERTTNPNLALWLGRLNFAAIVFTVLLAYLLVYAIAALPIQRRRLKILVGETLALGILTAATSLVDQAELLHPSMNAVVNSATVGHTTVFGPLVVVYFAHVLTYLTVAVLLAFNLRSARDVPATVRDQLLLIGGGILATGAVAFVTNVVLPYSFQTFRYIDIGPLSTILFVLAVSYAVVRHHLFDIRVFIRRTLVWGVLLSLVMAVYSAIILLVTDHLTEGAGSGFAKFGVLIIAGSFDPLRRFLEQKVDRLLFPRERKRAVEHR